MRSKHDSDRETRVILVRHGQSTYNALGLYQGSSDESVLTELGRSDARKTGHLLKRIAFDAIYSSPLKRARETATEILQIIPSHAKFKVTDKLRETALPAWQGLAFEYVRETFPAEYRLWKQHPHLLEMQLCPVSEVAGEQSKIAPLASTEDISCEVLQVGETTQRDRFATQWLQNPKSQIPARTTFFPALDLYQRVREFWQEVLPRHRGQTLLLVTHGGTNRALIATALGIAPDRYHCIQQSNCGISALNFPDGSLESARLTAMNLNTHIGESLPKPQAEGTGLRLLLVPSGTTAAQTQNIAKFLQQVQIDFSLNSVLDSSNTMAQQILQSHPQTIQFEVLREDIPEAWQAAISMKSKINRDRLITGLVMVSEETIADLICHAIGMSLNRIERLSIKKGTISCLQYPGDCHPPILQAMNISTNQNELFHQSNEGWTTSTIFD